MCVLDHLVIAAANLDEGSRWVEERIGAPLDAGGRHEAFGTHNRVLSLGPVSYLEVIALDPDVRPPRRPTWFELGTAAMHERLTAGPTLIHWVVRVGSVDGIPDPIELSRGDNRWVIGVPPDGRMLLGGLVPSRILWRTPPPSTQLLDKGVRLESLVISSPEPDRVRGLVRDVSGPVRVVAGAAGLSATLTTPHGRTVLVGSATSS